MLHIVHWSYQLYIRHSTLISFTIIPYSYLQTITGVLLIPLWFVYNYFLFYLLVFVFVNYWIKKSKRPTYNQCLSCIHSSNLYFDIRSKPAFNSIMQHSLWHWRALLIGSEHLQHKGFYLLHVWQLCRNQQ